MAARLLLALGAALGCASGAEPGKSCWFLHGSGCPHAIDCPEPPPASKNATLDKLPGEGRPTSTMPGYWGQASPVWPPAARACASVTRTRSCMRSTRQTFANGFASSYVAVQAA